MEEILWLMSQQSRVLQELRKDITQVWSDEAAREINARYLNSHESDESQMISALNKQKDLLDQATQKMELSQEQTSKAEEYATTVSENVKFAIQELDSAYSNYDMYIQYNSDARAKFPRIEQLINNANSACV
jgi:predicted enzyme involved in methoxymalonyl-ACP biosynthesis